MNKNFKNDAVPVTLHLPGRPVLACTSINQAAAILGKLVPEHGVHKEVVNFLRKTGATLSLPEGHPLKGLRVDELAEEERWEAPPSVAEVKETSRVDPIRRASREARRTRSARGESGDGPLEDDGLPF